MFHKDFSIMLYSSDVLADKTFWQAIGFTITDKEDLMGYPTFDMKVDATSPVTFTVFDLEFIKQVSPEVANHQPSILFETEHLAELHSNIKAHAPAIGDIQDQPFRNFNFQAPSGHYYAVKEK
ncbi:glyoxalase [Streptococcus cuniculipharyngis]|uniref:Glyoxalase n=1 Tax=Streptococcus cuniculipharyngis TaxID=1562651 RepID=A0A5C5SCQ7_9STRE|nr:glyoxalase [Streptococcus cuniculipharyngis]TWS98072.1 glyoxalase [Streptococcus cuniculipharyngis]